MRGIKISQQDFALKRWGGGGGAYARWGAYLRDTIVYVCASYMVVVWCTHTYVHTIQVQPSGRTHT